MLGGGGGGDKYLHNAGMLKFLPPPPPPPRQLLLRCIMCLGIFGKYVGTAVSGIWVTPVCLDSVPQPLPSLSACFQYHLFYTLHSQSIFFFFFSHPDVRVEIPVYDSSKEPVVSHIHSQSTCHPDVRVEITMYDSSKEPVVSHIHSQSVCHPNVRVEIPE